MEDKEVLENNKLIEEFIGFECEAKYKDSDMLDSYGNNIIQGSIINADGYKSHIERNQFHCVEYYEGQFGSDIYSDFDRLSTYNKIEVIGHIKDYDLDKIEWSGNAGACKIINTKLRYHSSWEWLMPVWYKFRDLEIEGETPKKLHTNYVARLAQDLAYGTIDEFFHNISIAIKWYNQNKTN